MKDEIRPVIKPILIVNLLGYMLVLGSSGILLWALRLPLSLAYSLLSLTTLLVGVFLALVSTLAYWRHLTERYSVDEDCLLVQRGWAMKTVGRIPIRNVAEAMAVMPLALRVFGVGSVVVSTNDGSVHTLFNIRSPRSVADSIKPTIEPVTRPSVG